MENNAVSEGKCVGRCHVDREFEIAAINDRLFGSFVEHLGRCIYTGIYEPTHPLADENGFRQDVIDLVRELGVTTIRYPGGNFVSGYRWEDGVGPRERRPKRLDLAWHSIENNEFGLHEMAQWLKAIGGNELMEAVNLGTRGTQEALDLLEYSNITKGTLYSDMRRANGQELPFRIPIWCLGNEMDGTWQLGHKQAEDYGKLAAMTALAMRRMDPGIELVVCGSSNHHIDTFGKWDQTVLDYSYDNIDLLSCHAYYHPENDDFASFMASGEDLDAYINSVSSLISAAKAKAKSNHEVYISLDEWNVWYSENDPDAIPTGIENWPEVPRLLEESYSVLAAVVFGDLLITILRNADKVKAASLAQLVNVIAPIMTEPGGPSWRQTIFYPFTLTANLAQGGKVLQTCQTSSSYSCDLYGEVPMTDSVAVKCADGSVAVFVVNRSMQEHINYSIEMTGFVEMQCVEAKTLHDEDFNAANTLVSPDRVRPTVNKSISVDGHHIDVSLPPVSWTVVHIH